MTTSEISSWLEKAYVHGTKGLAPLLRVLKNGLGLPFKTLTEAFAPSYRTATLLFDFDRE